MGAVNTTYTFTATDTITSTKMNNIIDQTTFTNDAVFDTTLSVVSGKLKVNAQGITSNELAANAVKTISIEDGSITQAKASNSLVPTGAIMPFAMNAAPTGWLIANGSLVNRTTYAALFLLIGTTYGAGNGSTTFQLPDLQGHFIRGFGTAAGSGAFGENQVAYAGSNTFTVGKDDGDDRTGPRGEVYSITINGVVVTTGNDKSVIQTQSIPTIAGDTRPKNIAMLYCIKH